MSGKYRTIVADPPWPFEWDGRAGGRRRRSTELGYETMAIEEIAALVGELPLPAPDATLLMWVTQEALHTGGARQVAETWGFPHRIGEWIWRKPNFGTGAFPRIGHETCVIYRRGSGSLRPDAPRDVHSVQPWRQPYAGGDGKIHSAKPDAFLDHVEQWSPGPYLELFARKARFGWDYWGDQSLGTAEMPEPATEPDCTCSYDAILNADDAAKQIAACPRHGDVQPAGISGGGGSNQMTVEQIISDIEQEEVTS